MITRATRTKKIEANRETIIATAGEVFSDGTIIELVSKHAAIGRPDLLIWQGSAGTIASTVPHDGRIYQACKLAPRLYTALRLPANYADPISVTQLFAEIVTVFQTYLNVADRESRLLTAFVLSTWLADQSTFAPGAIIVATQEQQGVEVLRMLHCLCRRALLLADLTPTSFRSLPMYLGLTLLLNQGNMKPNMQQLLRSTSYRGLNTSVAGDVVDLYGPKTILCGANANRDILGDGAIQISLGPQLSCVPLDEKVRNEIAIKFQPQLLRFRLENLTGGHDSNVELSEFTPETVQLARALGKGLADDEKLAQATINLLKDQDDELKTKQILDVNRVIIEILWGVWHAHGRRGVLVQQLTQFVNDLLASRGGTALYSAEEIGWALSKLHVPRRSVKSGRQVILNADAGQLLHHIAGGYNLSLVKSDPACDMCKFMRGKGQLRV